MKQFRGTRLKQVVACLGLAVTTFMAGCSGGGDGGGATANAAPGTLSVSLTDAPACGFDAVNVTVSRVRVHKSGSAEPGDAGWTDITVDPNHNKINLLDLNDPTQPNGALQQLGSETSLPAGHYTQVRLVLVPNNGNSQPFANSIVLQGQIQEIKLDTPSAVQSGIKLVNEFDVPSGQRVDLLLDFDACKSIVQTGNGTYKLKPVINVIPYALNGIEGFVDKNSFANQSLVGKNVIASAQFNGEIVRSTIVNTDTGKFFLAHLDPTKDYDVVITADNHATAVIASIPVDPAPTITPISTSGSPLPLANSAPQGISGTVMLSPTDDEGTVIVAAKQTLNPGPTVTVKSVVASVLDSAAPVGDYGYSVTLPTGAPTRGLFGPLPIMLSATVPDQSTVAKIYTVKGSAQVVQADGSITTYATQNPLPSAKDITVVANQTQDFTLTTP